MTGEGRKGRRLSKDEHDLWHGVTRSIAPLRGRRTKKTADIDEKGPLEKAPRSPRPLTPPPAPVKAKPAPALAPLERRLKQRLRRGKEDIDARIDLHGDTQSQAYDRLLRFLHNAQAKGATVALVITGKGARGGEDRERGVLKRQVPLWLGLPEFRDLVVGFDQASVAHGGEGALYVRMRKRRT